MRCLCPHVAWRIADESCESLIIEDTTGFEQLLVIGEQQAMGQASLPEVYQLSINGMTDWRHAMPGVQFDIQAIGETCLPEFS